MTVKKISGPGPPDLTGPQEPGTEPSGRVAQAFRQGLEATPAGPAAGRGLEGAVIEAVEAVRRGDLEPDRALDAIIESAREALAGGLPAGVDIEDVLQYIRETLQADPTFLALVEGTAPQGT